MPSNAGRQQVPSFCPRFLPRRALGALS